MKKLLFAVHGVSITGTVKAVNEDSFLYKAGTAGSEPVGLFAVADGVGSIGGGDKASRYAIGRLNQWWENRFAENYHDISKMLEDMRLHLLETNRQMLALQQEEDMQMATTFSAMVACRQQYHILHVGDSRIYRYTGWPAKRLVQLTKDHTTLVQRQNGNNKYLKSVLTNCLGHKAEFELFQTSGALHVGDVFVLCTDGVYKTQTPQDISDILHQSRCDVVDVSKQLVVGAKSNNEKDDITCIALHVGK